MSRKTRPRVTISAAHSESAIEESIHQISKSVPRIEDICKIVSSNTMVTKPYIGTLEDTEDTFLILSDVMSAHQPSADWPSLASLLRADSPIRLSRKQRYRIALVLASSHVQLFSSHWVSEWRRDKILFPSDNLDDPCIIYNVGSETGGHGKSDAIQSLGILLVELCYGQLLEDQQLSKKVDLAVTAELPPEVRAMLDVGMARNWARGLAGECGERFAGAVDWCLYGGQEEDKSWRRSVWTNVVEPLQWSISQFS